MKKSELIKKWILNYISENTVASATNQDFHEAFHEQFGGKFQPTFYGAQMVYKAQRYLKSMYDQGILDRHRVNCGPEIVDGFPNWEYVYTVRHPPLPRQMERA